MAKKRRVRTDELTNEEIKAVNAEVEKDVEEEEVEVKGKKKFWTTPKKVGAAILGGLLLIGGGVAIGSQVGKKDDPDIDDSTVSLDEHCENYREETRSDDAE